MDTLLSLLESFSFDHFCQILTASLGHLLWQGCLICLVAKLLTIVARSATAKYWINSAALGVLFLCLPITLHVFSAAETGTAARAVSLQQLSRAEPTVRKNTESVESLETHFPPEDSEANALVVVVPESTVASAPDRSSTWNRWPVAVAISYMAGVLFMLSRLGLGVFISRRIAKVALPIQSAEILANLRTTSKLLGLSIAPKLKSCSRLSVPVILGVIKPTILLPASIVANMPPNQISSILAHELVHLRRHDLILNLLQKIAECFTFYHPAAWWLSREVSRYREHACDDAVLRDVCAKKDYVDALLGMAEHCAEQKAQVSGLALAAKGASPSEFRQRVLRLLGERDLNRRINILPILATLFSFAAVIVFALVNVRANEGGQASSEPSSVSVGEWPQWGGNGYRNNARAGTAPQAWSDAIGDNVKWRAKLVDSSYFAPVIADGKVFAGTNSDSSQSSQARMICLSQHDGKVLWHYDSPRLETGRDNDWPGIGMASTPAVLGERLYFLSNRCEVVCLATDNGRVIWKVDLIGKLGVNPCKLQTSSPVIIDGVVLVGTSHGTSVVPDRFDPEAPSFVALDAQDGRILWKDSSPGKNVLHGQWSSPAYGVFNGVPQAIFAGGDGWLYSFDFRDIRKGVSNLLWKFDCNPKRSIWTIGGSGTRNNILATPVIHDGLVYIGVGQNPEHGEGPGHLWCIDPTKRGDVSSELILGPRESKLIQVRDVLGISIDGILPKNDAASSIDVQVGHPIHVLDDGTVSLPLVLPLHVSGLTLSQAKAAISKAYIDSRILDHREIKVDVIKIRSDQHRSVKPKRLQAASQNERVEDNPNSAAIWHYVGKDLNGDGDISVEERFGRTACSVAVKDGLLIACDFTGIVHCLDANTGRPHWTYDMFSSCYSTPLIVGDFIYVGDEDGDIVIFRLDNEFSLVAEIAMQESISGPLVSDGESLYVPAKKSLTVLSEGTKSEIANSATQADTASSTSENETQQKEAVVTARIRDLEASLSQLEDPSPEMAEALRSLRIRLQAFKRK